MRLYASVSDLFVVEEGEEDNSVGDEVRCAVSFRFCPAPRPPPPVLPHEGRHFLFAGGAWLLFTAMLPSPVTKFINPLKLSGKPWIGSASSDYIYPTHGFLELSRCFPGHVLYKSQDLVVALTRWAAVRECIRTSLVGISSDLRT